jgi:gluconolactonase
MSIWQRIVTEESVLERIATGFAFLEGPVWTRGSTLIFSDIPANTLYEWVPSGAIQEAADLLETGGPRAETGELRVFRQPSFNANGNTLDRQGRLITCEHSGRRVSRTEADGTFTTLAESYDGKRLNSPNDVVVHSGGAIYFTDPPYGLQEGEQELPFFGVFLITREGELELLVDDFIRPNGLALSPDESLLYIDDSDRRHIRVFDVKGDGRIEGGEVFADVTGDAPGNPDGMKVDVEGNVYCTGSGGIHVFESSGTHLGVIETPEVAANCNWGEDLHTLYIAAQTGLYRIRTGIEGVAPRA